MVNNYRGANVTIYTADEEEPKCGRCDNCCASQDVCSYCGPDYFWQHYKRTVKD